MYNIKLEELLAVFREWTIETRLGDCMSDREEAELHVDQVADQSAAHFIKLLNEIRDSKVNI